MDVEINIVPRIIIISILSYFMIKLVITLLHSGINAPKKKHSYDLDQLIKSKQDFLRGAPPVSPLSGGEPSSTHSQNTASAEAVYAQELKRTNAKESPEKFRDITSILELFDALKWGQGPALQRIKDEFNNKTRFRLDDQHIIRAAKKIDAQGLFLMLNQTELPSIKVFHQIIEQYLLLQLCAQEIDKNQFGLIDTLARSGRVSNSTYVDAITCWTKKKLGLRGNYREMGKMESPSILSTHEIALNPLFLFGEKRMEVLPILKTIKEWQSIAQLYQALIPLSELPKNDLEACLQLFGLHDLKTLNQEKLKKLYKIKAQSIHPDALMNLQLTSEEQQVITQNFQIIQEAYQVLKKNLQA